MTSKSFPAILFLSVFLLSEAVCLAKPVKESKPPVLVFYTATKEKRDGFTQGQFGNDKSLYCGPKIDFSPYVAEASCSREPGENAHKEEFIFVNAAGAKKLMELTKKSLRQFVAIDVNGKSVGLTKIQVVHKPLAYRQETRGLLTFSVGKDSKKGNELAKAINASRD